MRTPTNRDDAIAMLSELPRHRRLDALRIAADDALALWRASLDGNPIVYDDSIVGMRHQVDDTLPARALADVDRVLSGEAVVSTVRDDYAEPIVAMQDEDLDLADPIELAYYAIYNLHRIAIGATTLDKDEAIVVRQISNAVAVPANDWAVEWWTRVWDAWANRADPAYMASSMTAAVFDGLARGDLGAAIESLPRQTDHVRAVLCTLAGRRDDAVAAALRASGAPPSDEHARWLREHAGRLAPDAIAIDPRDGYAAIFGRELVVYSEGKQVRRMTFPDRVLRFVWFDRDERAVWIAADLADAVGVWGSGYWRESLDAIARPGNEVLGRAPILALGGHGIVRAHPREGVFHRDGQRELFGDTPVAGAAVSDDASVLATHDGERVMIWNRNWASATEVVGPAAPRRLTIGGDRLLVAWADGTASLHDLDG